MDFREYYQGNHTYLTHIDNRLGWVVKKAKEIRPKALLDIGCGEGTLLTELAKQLPGTALYGTDVYNQKPDHWQYVVSDITKKIEYQNNKFDLVIIGEVIEHVPDPDFVLREISRVLKPNGQVIVTTPNIASWANRLLLFFGIQPLFTETSTKQNVGRIFRVLGQGGKVQGHLKIFTKRSLKETIELNNFIVTSQRGSTFFFPSVLKYVDGFFSHFPSLASNLIVIARNNKRAK